VLFQDRLQHRFRINGLGEIFRLAAGTVADRRIDAAQFLDKRDKLGRFLIAQKAPVEASTVRDGRRASARGAAR